MRSLAASAIPWLKRLGLCPVQLLGHRSVFLFVFHTGGMRERGGVALRSSFAQRVLLTVAVAVLFSAICLAAEIGMFGEQIQDAVRRLWHPLWSTYHRHKWAFDAVALVIGTSVPALAGGLAILRKFYYAEIMLPRRLQELAEKKQVSSFCQAIRSPSLCPGSI